jgi:MHS family alpha-ketoglutarate permease-like MFS transporter
MTDTTQPGSPPLKRIGSIIAGSVGNLVEWYDWFIYASFSLYFAKAFFPKGDQTAQLLSAAAVFAVGFLMRPVGAWIMGSYADRTGRKAALTLSMLMMCAGSMIIALTPGFATIGVAAPIILVLARMLQGLSVGGEYGASATYMSEISAKANRGFWTSWQYVTMIFGQLMALATLMVLQSALPVAALEAWGWRLAFAIGGVLAVVAFYLRSGLVETPAFLKMQAKAAAAEPSLAKAGRLAGLLAHPRETLMVIGMTMGGSLAYYAFTTYMQKFLHNTSGFSKETATSISAASLVVFMVLQPVSGWMSDKFGRKPMLIGFGVLGTALSVPIFTQLSHTTDAFSAFVLVSCALAILSAYSAISAVVKAELFPAHVRALGVALPYALANSIFGGTAEYVALWLKQDGKESWFYIYVSACLAVSLLVYLTMPDTRDKSRILED